MGKISYFSLDRGYVQQNRILAPTYTYFLFLRGEGIFSFDDCRIIESYNMHNTIDHKTITFSKVFLVLIFIYVGLNLLSMNLIRISTTGRPNTWRITGSILFTTGLMTEPGTRWAGSLVAPSILASW